MGHQNCGAVQAALSQTNGGDNLNHLIEHIQSDNFNHADLENPHRKRCHPTKCIETVHKDLIENSEDNFAGNAVEQRQLEIRTAYYHLDSGRVEFLN